MGIIALIKASPFVLFLLHTSTSSYDFYPDPTTIKSNPSPFSPLSPTSLALFNVDERWKPKSKLKLVY